MQPSQREAVRRPAPTRFRAREQAGGLSGGEAFVGFLDAEVAGLQQAAEMAGGKIGFNPVAESDQRSAWTRERGGDSWAERDWPLVAEGFFPDQCHVRIRHTRDFDLVQRRAARQNPAEHLFDLRFTAAGMKERDLRLWRRLRRDSGRLHQERERIRRAIRRDALGHARRQTSRHNETGQLERTRTDPFARHRVNQRALERAPRRIRQLRPAILRLNRAPVQVLHGLFVNDGHVAAALLFKEVFVRPEQRNELGVLGRR